jgi:hypothetical protein
VSHDAVPAVLIATAAILSAALGLRAATLASSAAGSLESAVRVEVKQGAADVQDALLVFDEAPASARVAATRFRSEELRREAETADFATGRQLLAESVVLGVLAQALGGKDGGEAALEVDRRLEERRAQQRLTGPSATELEESGRDEGRRAALMAFAAAPAGLAFLLGAAAQAFPRRRRLLVAAGAAVLVLAAAGGVWVETAA